MGNEASPPAPMPERNLSVIELIRATEAASAKGGPKAAQALYAGWIEHNANDPLLHAVLFNYSVVLSDAGDLAAARACLERAVELNPEFMPAHINLGRVYERLGATASAVQQWSRALERLTAINGGSIAYKTTVLNQAARVLEAANQDEPAGNMLRQSLEIDNQQREAAQHYLALRQRQCEWPIVQPWERVGRETLMRGISPLSAAAYTDDPLLQLAMAWHYNKVDVGNPVAPILTSHWAARRPGRLRIGYLSSDLREHAVGHLMAEVLELHDREAVEVHAYYSGPRTSDAMQAAFKAGVDHWLDITDMPDATAARRIADDGVQILVDLNGYTREGRTKLVALRPAPVIVNWLGFPGTMASPYHHYIIADDWIIPPDAEIFYSEKVLRLPCYQPNNRKRAVSERVWTRIELKLPEEGTVFCCFNGSHKITRFTFERWLAILERVPGSVLWLLTGAETTNERLRRHARERGIAPERLVFADKMGNADHLARYRLADLFLDTAPYGAHTTASDALWMGVPVLTLDGRCFAARVCGSLVAAAGLPELVCASVEDYVDRAVALGRDRSLTQRYRERLLAGQGTCTLFDTPRLVRELEGLYLQMWSDHEAGRLPRPDLANLDVYLEIGSSVDHDGLEVQALGDYRKWWLEQLEKRHAYRPIAPDRRLFTPG